MAEEAPRAKRTRRERISHWLHPVDEDRRLKRAQSHRRRRLAILLAILVLVSLIGVYSYLTSDRRIQSLAEAYLEDLLGTQVTMSRASFSWSDGLVLEDLQIVPPEPFTDPLLRAGRVYLRVKPLSVLLLSPEVTEIVVREPWINLVLWDEQTWNFQALARTKPLAVLPAMRPIVALEEGTLRVERRVAGVAVYEREMRVSGLLLPSETERDTFRFQTDVKSQTVNLSVASGLVDTQTGSLRFEGQASNVALGPDLYKALPLEARRIWDRFEPTGSVNVKVLFDEKEGFRLVTDLTGVSFAPAYKGLTYRFENLTGRCAIAPGGLKLSGVRGLVNGTPVRLDGDVTGFDAERLGLDLSVQVDHVNFKDSRQSLVTLAPAIQVFYDWYDPSGQVDVAMKVRRASGADAPLEVTGTGLLRSTEVTYVAFPYRLERMRGAIRFGPQGYETDDLTGYHGAAEFHLAGWAKDLGTPLMESRVRVRGRGVPLDEDLRAALGPFERRIYDQYAPSGSADVDADIYREPKADARPQATVRLNLLDCRFRYENFPYVLTGTTGQVNIFPGRTEIVNVRGRHGPASVTFSGEVLWPDVTKPAEGLIRIVGTDVPLDEDLEAALPERDRTVMRAFHLSGAADIEGTVTSTAETKNELAYDLDVSLKNARMVYEPFPLLAEQMTGRLHLARGTCRIDSITGYNSGARIDARGWIEQRPDDFAMDLVLVGKDVVLGEPLRGALGPEMRTVWSHLAPQGRVDISARLTKALGTDQTIQHHVLVTALDAQARLDLFPYPLEHVSGQLEFEGSEVRLKDLRARSGPTEFGFTGRIAYGPEGPQFDLAIRASGLRLEGPLEKAIPAPIQQAFQALHPVGRVDLNLARLTYRTTGPDRAEVVWSASALLDEVGAEPGVKISGVVGTATMDGRWADGRVDLKGNVRVQQGRFAGRILSDTRFAFEKPADSAALAIRGIEGEFYEGRVEGSAGIRFDPSARYTLTMAATGVNFERLLREGFRIEHNISGGRLAMTLGLRAGNDPSDMEASGYADVTDARLYELPLVVRVLAALRLAPADRAAFEKARILYFVRGQRLYLGDIRLMGRALSLYGAGTLEPDGQLNLTFLTGKKDADPLIPALSELAEGIRRELVIVLVTGTLAEPKVEMRTLSSLTAPLRELVRLVREQRAREAAGKRR